MQLNIAAILEEKLRGRTYGGKTGKMHSKYKEPSSKE